MDPTTVAREARVERLRQARIADSKAKTKRSLDAVASLIAAGERITVARVACKAAVSTWFVYNSPDVHRRCKPPSRNRPGTAFRPLPEAANMLPVGEVWRLLKKGEVVGEIVIEDGDFP
ncbi:hypothetical protein ACIQWV_37675 [Streptomyces sp. NPDC098085]|uniref:hypothetical protein n=1 Tax=Streptomyces sp. NPDC098085 TaxID=3366094 RepID=UPI003800001B